ncbi:endonuclease dU [Geoglobus sp.]
MKQARFLGIDDSFSGKRCVIAGVVTEGSCYVEGVMVESIAVDGMDVTDKIVRMVSRSKFREQIRCIFLGGITFGGFNVADIEIISDGLSTPVVVVMRKRPDLDSIKRALQNLEMGDERLSTIEKAGEIREAGGIFIQFTGCDYGQAVSFLKSATLKGYIPECLRLAHIVASAVIHGENRGRA